MSKANQQKLNAEQLEALEDAVAAGEISEEEAERIRQGKSEAAAEAEPTADDAVLCEQLEAKLTATEHKMAEYKEQAMRAHAEMENLRRRSERDVEKAHKFGSEKLLKDLLPVVDSLVRGLEGFADDDPHAEGMKLTLDLLEKTLEKHGVITLDPQPGEVFNPEKHQAMTMQPAGGELQPNTVVKVLQKGFELNQRVIRAAMVIVAQ